MSVFPEEYEDGNATIFTMKISIPHNQDLSRTKGVVIFCPFCPMKYKFIGHFANHATTCWERLSKTAIGASISAANPELQRLSYKSNYANPSGPKVR